MTGESDEPTRVSAPIDMESHVHNGDDLYDGGDAVTAIGHAILRNFGVFMVCVALVICTFVAAASWSGTTRNGQRLQHERETRRLDLCEHGTRDTILCP